MHKTPFEKILDQIAVSRQISPALLRKQMQHAMESALCDPDPAVQAMWNSIPRQGQTPTLEEFMDYLVKKNMLLP